MDEKNLVDSVFASLPTPEHQDESRISYFEDEIEMINDPKIKSFVRSVLKMSDPFWISPASMIENSHPPDEYESNGMVLHTKRVVRAAALLMATVDINTEQADCVFAAAILHDITKAIWLDESMKVMTHDSMHPYSVDLLVKMCRIYDEENNIHPPQDNSLEIDKASLEIILKLIRFSHGIFSPIPETVPTNEFENLLHTADLIAANLHVLVDGPNIIEERWLV